MNVSKIIFFLITIYSFAPLHAQQNQDKDCIVALKKYVKQISSIDFPKGKQVYFMDMTVKSITRSNGSSDARVKIYLGNKQIHYESNQISGYQDEKDAFMVVHPNKSIIWSKGGKRPDASVLRDQAGRFQDTLVEMSVLKSCELIDWNGRTVKKIVLEPIKKIREYTKIIRMEYLIDTEKEQLLQVDMKYLPGEEFISKIITYNMINWNAKRDMSVGVYYRIFNDNKKFHKQYSNYTLVDNRK